MDDSSNLLACGATSEKAPQLKTECEGGRVHGVCCEEAACMQVTWVPYYRRDSHKMLGGYETGLEEILEVCEDCAKYIESEDGEDGEEVAEDEDEDE